MARKTVDAYAPILNATFEKKYGARVLNYYIWPSQMFYCNSPIKGLADIKGKKVRVQGTSQGDLVEALGATGVTIPFAEVVPALQRGTVDCGITGTMPAYKAGWHEVTSHVLDLPVGFSVSFTIVSLATWGKLDDKTKAFMESAVKGQTDKWWKTIIDEDTMGLNCTTGTGECTVGKPGKLVKVEPAAADSAHPRDGHEGRRAQALGQALRHRCQLHQQLERHHRQGGRPDRRASKSHAHGGRMERTASSGRSFGRPHAGGVGSMQAPLKWFGSHCARMRNRRRLGPDGHLGRHLHRDPGPQVFQLLVQGPR